MPSRCFLEGTANCRLRNVSETTTSPSSFHETPTMGTHSGNTSPSSASSLISLYVSPPMMPFNDYKASDTENKETNTTPKRNNKSTRVFPQRGNSVGCCSSDEFMNSEFVKGDNYFFGRKKKRECRGAKHVVEQFAFLPHCSIPRAFLAFCCRSY